MQITLKQGSRYKVYIKLNLFEIGYDNDSIKLLGESVGLSNVEVWGGGSVRHATGTWDKETQTVNLPDEVRDIEEMVS